jgi:glycosyltransferase involved in cell wall biosynthesis
MPYDGIGGVERAAATAEGARRGDLKLECMFVFEDVVDRSSRGKTFNPYFLWSSADRLLRLQPDLVILSLWRSVIVAGIAKMRGCRAPTVLFLHNARHAHLLDRLVTLVAAGLVDAIWADSATTLTERLPVPPRVPSQVISYMLDRAYPVRQEQPDPKPDLIFWGRMAEQKDPLRMLRLFAQLHAVRPDATLMVIGPDGGLEHAMREEIAKRGLQDAVTLAGPLQREQIATFASRASFYLQTSRYEGMALSVMEAMQAGLVPVVTPVGEIARYTDDGFNALWIHSSSEADDAAAVKRIEAVIDDPGVWRDLRAAAIRTFACSSLYVDDVMAASAELLDSRVGRLLADNP